MSCDFAVWQSCGKIPRVWLCTRPAKVLTSWRTLFLLLHWLACGGTSCDIYTCGKCAAGRSLFFVCSIIPGGVTLFVQAGSLLQFLLCYIIILLSSSKRGGHCYFPFLAVCPYGWALHAQRVHFPLNSPLTIKENRRWDYHQRDMDESCQHDHSHCHVCLWYECKFSHLTDHIHHCCLWIIAILCGWSAPHCSHSGHFTYK